MRTSAFIVGSISRDLRVGVDGAEHAFPGGVVHHAGLALRAAGVAVTILTRVAHADRWLLDPLHKSGANVASLPSRETTTYRNDYRGPIDRHTLLACSDPIAADDIPTAWSMARWIHLGPLHPEDVQPCALRRLATLAAGAPKGLDVQGLLRVRAGTGHAVEAPGLSAWLPHLSVVQVSDAEWSLLAGTLNPEAWARRHGVEELLVTRGRQGARLVIRGSGEDIPPHEALALPPHAKVGAGDVFLACYLSERSRGRAPARSARAASRRCVGWLDRRR